MKMGMKISKTQVKSVEKLVGGTGVTKTFYRTPAIQAGYKQMDVMCIGASGGYSTQAALNYWGSGGGGGGSILRRFNMATQLSEANNYSAGTKGQDWSAGGFDGSGSYFGGIQGYGGKGAGGITGGWGSPDVYASIGASRMRALWAWSAAVSLALPKPGQ